MHYVLGKTIVALGTMIIVAVAHVVVGVFFYYGRVASLSPIFDSDLVVFLVPALLGFGGYLCVMWPHVLPASPLPVKTALVISIALVATMISRACMAIVAFSNFGS